MVDGSQENRDRLRIVVDRVIPADHEPGALDLGTDRYVIAQLSDAAKALADDIAAGLDSLELAAHLRFAASLAILAPEQVDVLLKGVEDQPWFLALAELAAEGFYADPDNGGNAGARSWDIIGYEHRLPDGPSGPPAAGALSAAPLRRI